MDEFEMEIFPIRPAEKRTPAPWVAANNPSVHGLKEAREWEEKTLPTKLQTLFLCFDETTAKVSPRAIPKN